MTEKRKAIVEAKRHLYHLILKLGFGEMTNDDLRMGEALMRDSEIQTIFEKANSK